MNANWLKVVDTIRDVARGQVVGYHHCKASEIQFALGMVESLGLARLSRRGWYTVDHPEAGTIQWKGGHGHWHLRLNGQPVFDYVQVQGYSEWTVRLPEATYPKDTVEQRTLCRTVYECLKDGYDGVNALRWYWATKQWPDFRGFNDEQRPEDVSILK